MQQLHASFRPEFLNRLDEIILFKPLVKGDIARITELTLADINRRLADKRLTVALSPEAQSYIEEKGFDPTLGARPLKRYMQKYVETLTARVILEDRVKEGDTIRIVVKNGELAAEVEAA